MSGRRLDWACSIALILPWLVAHFAFREFAIYPTNDDWLYAQSVRYLVEEGRWQWVSHNGELPAAAVTPIALAAGLCSFTGFSFDALHVVSQLLTAFGPVAVYAIGRLAGALPFHAVIPAFALLFCPWYWGHGFTFMTDSSSVGLGLLAGGSFCVACLRDDLRWMLAGSLFLGLAVGTRQTALAFLLVPWFSIFVFWIRKEVSLSRAIAMGCAGAVGSVVVLGLLESGIFGPSNRERLVFVTQRPELSEWLKSIIYAGYSAKLVVGAALLPLAPILFAAIKWNRTTGIAALVGLLPLVFFLVRGGRAVLGEASGPFVTNAHFGPTLCSDCHDPGRWGDMGVTWPISVWWIASVASLLTIGLMVAAAANTLLGFGASRDRIRVLETAFLVCGVATAVVILLLMGFYFDRYWIAVFAPLMPWVALLIARTKRQPSTATTLLSIVLILPAAFVSVVFTHDWLAFNQARWNLVEAYREQGFEPKEIDGGYEINGWFRAMEDPNTLPRQGFEDARWWSGEARRWISVGNREGKIVDRESRWFSWAVGREVSVLGLRSKDDR